MPRHKTGEKLGRPFIYISDAQRPVMVSLRLPRALFDEMEAYRRRHGRGVTEVLVDGLTRSLRDEAVPEPTPNGRRYDGNAVLARGPEAHPAHDRQYDDHPARGQDTPLTPGMSEEATDNAASSHTVQAGPAPDFDRKKYRLGEPCKHGHASHGAAGNLRELVSSLCVTCRALQKAARQQARVLPQEAPHEPHG